MSEEDNKALVRGWIETFNNPYTPQTEVDVLTPGYIAHAPWLPGPLDLEAWEQFTATFVEAFPDLRLTVEDILSEGDMVAARVAFRGTHRLLHGGQRFSPAWIRPDALAATYRAVDQSAMN